MGSAVGPGTRRLGQQGALNVESHSNILAKNSKKGVATKLWSIVTD